jgi:hypothetical protein
VTARFDIPYCLSVSCHHKGRRFCPTLETPEFHLLISQKPNAQQARRLSWPTLTTLRHEAPRGGSSFPPGFPADAEQAKYVDSGQWQVVKRRIVLLAQGRTLVGLQLVDPGTCSPTGGMGYWGL